MNRSKLMALTLGASLVLGALVVPATAMAAGNNLRAVVSNPAPAIGSTFTVSVVANTDVPINGIGATLTFDSSRVQLTDMAKGSEFSTATWGGWPSASTMASFIASANAAGKVAPQISSFLSYPDNLAAGADHALMTLTFQAIAAGSVDFGLPVNGLQESMILDGSTDTYGDPLAITVASGSVTIPAPATPSPTAVPTITPPPASAPPGAGTTNVTGTLDSGFLGLTVPQNVTIPLVRNATNTVDVPVVVYSNIIWNVTVTDYGTAHTGHMVDGAKFLSNPMYATAASTINLEVGGTVQSGASSQNFPVTLGQFVAPSDQPGSYGIALTFAAISGF